MPLPKIPSGSSNKKINKMPDLEEEVRPLDELNPSEGEFSPLSTEEIEAQDIEDDEIDEDYDTFIEEEIETEEINEKHPQIDEPFAEETDIPYDDDQYIDKKNRKLKPFGKKDKPRKSKKGKKQKTNLNAKDFDDRKNTLTAVRIARTGMIILVIGLFGFGVKNTFFPSHVYTKDQIQDFALESIGQTGFPLEKGQAFAEQFAEAYFTLDTNDDNSSKILNTFYGNQLINENALGQIVKMGTNKQSIIIAPRTFARNPVSEEIAVYKVATMVTDRENNSFDESGDMNAKWVGLSITVYQDPNTGELLVGKDSPQLIPAYNTKENSSLPAESPLGTGVSDANVYDSMAPTINGFLKAYAVATPTSHSEVDQYVKVDADSELFEGFGGKFFLKDDELSNAGAIIYPSTEDENNKEWKIDLALQWHDSTNEDNSEGLVYSGRYIMTIEQSKDGKYFVTAFRPYVYTPSDEIISE